MGVHDLPKRMRSKHRVWPQCTGSGTLFQLGKHVNRNGASLKIKAAVESRHDDASYSNPEEPHHKQAEAADSDAR